MGTSTYAVPLLVVDMAVHHGTAYLILELIGEFAEAVQVLDGRTVEEVLGLLRQVGQNGGGGAAPSTH